VGANVGDTIVDPPGTIPILRLGGSRGPTLRLGISFPPQPWLPYLTRTQPRKYFSGFIAVPAVQQHRVLLEYCSQAAALKFEVSRAFELLEAWSDEYTQTNISGLDNWVDILADCCFSSQTGTIGLIYLLRLLL
jgi:hypothetical protein